MIGSLGTVDLVICAGALTLTVLIGLYFTRSNKTIDSYMKADGELSVVPVALSLMSSSISGLTMIGSGAELYYQGPSYSFVCLAMLLSGPIAAVTILPVFYKMQELSLHTYLEQRFGSSVRNFLSIMYIAKTIFQSAVTMYMPALALESILGLDKHFSILITGVLCVLYSTLGGIRAVVWTDAFLGLIMIVSLSLMLVFGTIDAGGISRVLELGAEGQRLSLEGFFDFSLTARHTIYGLTIGATLQHVYVLCVNQVQMQRVLSLGSLHQAQWAFVLASVFAFLVSIMSSYLGLILYAAYRGCDPFLGGQIRRRDTIIIHYIGLRVAQVPGLQGIFSAGILSGALSAVSSFANSMAALMVEDFIIPIRKRLSYKPIGNKSTMFLAKGLSAVSGVMCIMAACVMDKSGARILQTSSIFGGAIGVPIVAAFAVGIFTRCANSRGLTTALVTCFSVGLYLIIYQTFHSRPLEPTTPVFYNQECANIFNKSTTIQEANYIADHFSPPAWKPVPEPPPLALGEISYIMVPAMMFLICVFITLIVSLLTGGDDPEDRLIIKALRRR